KDRKGDERRLHAEIGRLDAELVALAPIEELSESVEEADSRHRELAESDNRRKTLSAAADDLAASHRRHEFHEREYKCLLALLPPPGLEDTSSLASLINDLEEAAARKDSDRARVAALTNVPPPPALNDVSTLASANRLRDDADRAVERWSRRLEI